MPDQSPNTWIAIIGAVLGGLSLPKLYELLIKKSENKGSRIKELESLLQDKKNEVMLLKERERDYDILFAKTFTFLKMMSIALKEGTPPPDYESVIGEDISEFIAKSKTDGEIKGEGAKIQ